MPQGLESKIRTAVRWVRGYEPPPPIGDYAEPPSTSDRRQMYAILIVIAFIGIVAFGIVYFDLFGLRSDVTVIPTVPASPGP